MRIISPFKDYYDYLGCPTDNRHIYKRVTNQVLPERKHILSRRKSLLEYVVGFAGKVLFAYAPENSVGGLATLAYNKLYAIDDMVAEWDEFIGVWPEYSKGEKSLWNSNKTVREHIAQNRPTYNKLFFAHNCPFFLLDLQSGILYLNLPTKMCGKVIYSRYTPEQAAQQLEMFLFNDLGAAFKEKMPPVSNKDLIEAKGFDLKTSFRKPKGA